MDTGEMLSRVALATLKHTAVAADRVRRVPRGVVVLLYHRVGRRSLSRVDLPEWLFDEQMARIAGRTGTVPFGDAIEQLESPSPPGRPPVAVTFDDGTADFVDAALPILVRHGVPATLYVATDFIESQRSFPQDGPPASWSGLRDALSTGLVTIGSHTHSHLLLDRTDPTVVAADLDRSIDLIGDRLGVRPVHFAYPKALLGSPDVEREVQARFASAALAGTKPNRFGRTDRYRVSRTPVQIEDGLRFFDKKVSGGMRLEDDVRRLANRRRLARRSS